MSEDTDFVKVMKRKAYEAVKAVFPYVDQLGICVWRMETFPGTSTTIEPPTGAYERALDMWRGRASIAYKDQPNATFFLREGLQAEEGHLFALSKLNELRENHYDLWYAEDAAMREWESDASGDNPVFVGHFDPYWYYARGLLTDPVFHSDIAEWCPTKVASLPGAVPLLSPLVVERKNLQANVGFPWYEHWNDDRRDKLGKESNAEFHSRIYAAADEYTGILDKLAIATGPNMVLKRIEEAGSKVSLKVPRCWTGNKRNQGRGRLTMNGSNDTMYFGWQVTQPINKALEVVPWYYSGDLLRLRSKARRFLRGDAGMTLVKGDDDAIMTSDGIVCADFSMNDVGFQPILNDLFLGVVRDALLSVQRYVPQYDLGKVARMYGIQQKHALAQPLLVPAGLMRINTKWGVRSGDPNTSLKTSWGTQTRNLSVNAQQGMESVIRQLQQTGHVRKSKVMTFSSKRTVELGQQVIGPDTGYSVVGLLVRKVRRLYDTEDARQATGSDRLWWVELAGMVSSLSYLVGHPCFYDVCMFVAERIPKWLRRRLTPGVLSRVYRLIVEEDRKIGRETGQEERRRIAIVWQILLADDVRLLR